MDDPQVVSRDERAAAPAGCNYRHLDDLGPDWHGRTGEMHGISAFLRRGDRHLPPLLQLRAGHRHGQQHMPVTRPDRPRPAGRPRAPLRAQRRPAAELAPPPRQIRYVAAIDRSRHRVADDTLLVPAHRTGRSAMASQPDLRLTP
jgi:hypothetical protein